MKRCLFCLAFLAVAGAASATPFLINSPASYLRANGEVPNPALIINLNAAGFFAGQTVLLTRGGAYNHLGGGLPTDYGLSAVFSSTNAMLGPAQLNRIPGAIDAGVDYVSPPTFVGGLPTDIAEDFEVDNEFGTANGVTLVIPTGAFFLVAAAEDDFFTDNNNTPEFYISIQTVPEPSSILVVAGALALFARRRR